MSPVSVKGLACACLRWASADVIVIGMSLPHASALSTERFGNRSTGELQASTPSQCQLQVRRQQEHTTHLLASGYV